MTISETQQSDLSLEELAKDATGQRPKEPLGILVVEPIDVRPRKRKRKQTEG